MNIIRHINTINKVQFEERRSSLLLLDIHQIPRIQLPKFPDPRQAPAGTARYKRESDKVLSASECYSQASVQTGDNATNDQ